MDKIVPIVLTSALIIGGLIYKSTRTREKKRVEKGKSQFFKDKVVQMAAEAEYVKIDRESNFRPDHRERPNNQYPEEFKRRVARAACRAQNVERA